MLGKLIKYETKASMRMILPLYAILPVLALLTRLLVEINGDNVFLGIFRVVSGLAYGLSMGAIIVLPVILMIQRFYKSLLGDEGYLMHTLPLKTWKNIVSKLLVSLMWILGAGIVVVLSVLIVAGAEKIRDFFVGDFFGFVEDLKNNYGLNFWWMTVQCVIVGLLWGMSSILMVYASVSIGHLSSKHRFISSVGAYIGLNAAIQMISASVIAFGGFLFEDWLPELSVKGVWIFVISALLLYQLVFGTVFFVITNGILGKRLNLE